MYVLSIVVCPFVLFFWPLCCLFFFDIRILITPLVSSNSSKIMMLGSLSDFSILINNIFFRLTSELKTCFENVNTDYEKNKLYRDGQQFYQ